MRASLMALGAFALAGCSTIVDGTSQTITVNTDPPGATCGLYREGKSIGTIQGTPASVPVRKTKRHISIACVLSGYQQATYLNRSGAAGATAGNILLGGAIGWAIDSSTGADNKYQSPVNVTMVPVAPGMAEEPAVLPSSLTLPDNPVAAPAPPAEPAPE